MKTKTTWKTNETNDSEWTWNVFVFGVSVCFFLHSSFLFVFPIEKKEKLGAEVAEEKETHKQKIAIIIARSNYETKEEERKTIVMFRQIHWKNVENKTQMCEATEATATATAPSNWTLALSSRAFQVRKIDRINTYLAVYGAVWRLKIISHQHDTTTSSKITLTNGHEMQKRKCYS